jgi:hypothetical protein
LRWGRTGFGNAAPRSHLPPVPCRADGGFAARRRRTNPILPRHGAWARTYVAPVDGSLINFRHPCVHSQSAVTYCAHQSARACVIQQQWHWHAADPAEGACSTRSPGEPSACLRRARRRRSPCMASRAPHHFDRRPAGVAQSFRPVFPSPHFER